jgi:hypothetical protein
MVPQASHLDDSRDGQHRALRMQVLAMRVATHDRFVLVVEGLLDQLEDIAREEPESLSGFETHALERMRSLLGRDNPDAGAGLSAKSEDGRIKEIYDEVAKLQGAPEPNLERIRELLDEQGQLAADLLKIDPVQQRALADAEQQIKAQQLALRELLQWLEHKADVEDSHDWLPDERPDTAINGVRIVIEEVKRRLK